MAKVELEKLANELADKKEELEELQEPMKALREDISGLRNQIFGMMKENSVDLVKLRERKIKIAIKPMKKTKGPSRKDILDRMVGLHGGNKSVACDWLEKIYQKKAPEITRTLSISAYDPEKDKNDSNTADAASTKKNQTWREMADDR